MNVFRCPFCAIKDLPINEKINPFLNDFENSKKEQRDNGKANK